MNNSSGLFRKYGKSYQEKIFQAFITDKNWAAQMSEVMTPDFFELKYLKFLTEEFFGYFVKYKAFPTFPILENIIKENLGKGKDIVLRDQVLSFLIRVKSNPDVGDLKYVKENSLDFCRRQAMKDALEKAVELIASDKVESVVGLMKTALSAGLPSTVGHDFFEDVDHRFTRVNRYPCPTGLAQLDQQGVLSGGLGAGEIGVITAPTGVGKSHFLVSLGAEALRRGKNVIHYTFELTETSVGIRYDSNLCDIDSDKIIENKLKVIDHYETNEDYGRLIIKEFPTGSASVVTIRNHIEKLMLKSFVPHVIIIDYADIMRSTRRFDSLRHELKLIYEELRNMAMEMRLPVWTASQSNKDGASSDVVKLSNMAEAYGKAQVADVVLTLSRKPEEKAQGTARMFVAKNRAGKDGVLFPITIDTARSKFCIVEGSEGLSIDEILQGQEQNLKDKLKEKWREVNEK